MNCSKTSKKNNSNCNNGGIADNNGNFDLNDISQEKNTIRFIGKNAVDRLSASQSNKGDTNKDGIDDIVIGAPAVNMDKPGETYLMLGRSQSDWNKITDSNGNFNLNDITKSKQIFTFIGRNNGDTLGRELSSGGDNNKDGFAEIFIGARAADGGGIDSGEAYLVFGRNLAGWNNLTDSNGNFNLNNITKSSNIVRFIGKNSLDYAGTRVINEGDVNGDGYSDLMMSTERDSSQKNEIYLAFGRSQKEWNKLTDSNGNFNLDNAGKANCVLTFTGRNAGDRTGNSMSNAGDINNDGIDDVIVGVPSGEPDKKGETYIIFGRSFAGWNKLTDSNGNFDLNNLSKANNTVRFIGRQNGDQFGNFVRNMGDVNCDGIADLMIGAWEANGGGNHSGEAYLVFGRSQKEWNNLTDANGNFDFNNLTKASNIIRFIGRNPDDEAGYSVNNAGDVNGDGVNDVLIGADAANGTKGETYLILGRSQKEWNKLTDSNGVFNLDNLSKANNTVTFIGRNYGDYSGRASVNGGDNNKDGIADILIDANRANGDGEYLSGEAYLIMGRPNWYTDSTNHIITAKYSDKTVTGTKLNDNVTGNNLSNAIYGKEGNDQIDGKSGNDAVYCGTGNDKIYDDSGNERYYFDANDGIDSITDTVGNDLIKLGSHVNKNKIAFFKDKSGNLCIDYGNKTGVDKITVNSWNNSANQIEKIQLNDGTFITNSDVNKIIQAVTTYAADKNIDLTNVSDVKNNSQLMNLFMAHSWHH